MASAPPGLPPVLERQLPQKQVLDSAISFSSFAVVPRLLRALARGSELKSDLRVSSGVLAWLTFRIKYTTADAEHCEFYSSVDLKNDGEFENLE